jgi:hypothetical protein
MDASEEDVRITAARCDSCGEGVAYLYFEERGAEHFSVPVIVPPGAASIEWRHVRGCGGILTLSVEPAPPRGPDSLRSYVSGRKRVRVISHRRQILADIAEEHGWDPATLLDEIRRTIRRAGRPNG